MINELHKRSAQVPQLVWKEGQKLQPNPLDTVFRSSEAGVILGRVLFQIFRSVCVDYNVTSEGVIQDMFDYIEQQQASKIRNCFNRDTFMPKKEKENDT